MLAALLFAAQATGCPLHQEVLEGAASQVSHAYVDQARADEISKALRSWAASDRYAGACGHPDVFLERLNRDLDVYDGHFHVELKAQVGRSDDWLMQWRAGASSSNSGIREVRVLEGNIGYVRISTFYPWDVAGEKLGYAWALVGDTQGLILDFRQNGGGAADTPMQIVASLLGPEVDVVQDIESRKGIEPEALPESELPRYTNPVVVLVDRRTASAAEYLAYSLQASDRALVLGSRTAGVAHLLGAPVALPSGYQILIPDARPVNRLTSRNWEGSGVTPDVSGGDDPVFIARLHLAKTMESKP